MKKPGLKKQWQAFEKQRDEDIDYSEIPELSDEFFEMPAKRPNKVALSMRLDADVVEWLRGFGAGYQTRTNMMLRKLMLASQRGRT